GTPHAGAAALLRSDAYTQGPRIFAKNCASCHRYDGHDGLGGQPKDAEAASDLKDFGSREWLAGFLDPKKIDSPHYYGGAKIKNGKMAKFVKNEGHGFGDAGKKLLQKAIAALAAEAGLKSQLDLEKGDNGLIDEGTKALVGDTMGCMECHKFHDSGDDSGTAPDLTAWASREWMIGFVSNPEHERFFG